MAEGESIGRPSLSLSLDAHRWVDIRSIRKRNTDAGRLIFAEAHLVGEGTSSGKVERLQLQLVFSLETLSEQDKIRGTKLASLLPLVLVGAKLSILEACLESAGGGEAAENSSKMPSWLVKVFSIKRASPTVAALTRALQLVTEGAFQLEAEAAEAMGLANVEELRHLISLMPPKKEADQESSLDPAAAASRAFELRQRLLRQVKVLQAGAGVDWGHESIHNSNKEEVAKHNSNNNNNNNSHPSSLHTSLIQQPSAKQRQQRLKRADLAALAGLEKTLKASNLLQDLAELETQAQATQEREESPLLQQHPNNDVNNSSSNNNSNNISADRATHPKTSPPSSLGAAGAAALAANLPVAPETKSSRGPMTREEYLGQRKSPQIVYFLEQVQQLQNQRLRAGLPKFRRVLDVGGGRGDLAVAMAEHFGVELSILVIDSNAQSVHEGLRASEKSKKRCKESGEPDPGTIEFIVGRLTWDATTRSVAGPWRRKPAFDLILALHACGSLSDLALMLAAERRATPDRESESNESLSDKTSRGAKGRGNQASLQRSSSCCIVCPCCFTKLDRTTFCSMFNLEVGPRSQHQPSDGIANSVGIDEYQGCGSFDAPASERGHRETSRNEICENDKCIGSLALDLNMSKPLPHPIAKCKTGGLDIFEDSQRRAHVEIVVKEGSCDKREEAEAEEDNGRQYVASEQRKDNNSFASSGDRTEECSPSMEPHVAAAAAAAAAAVAAPPPPDSPPAPPPAADTVSSTSWGSWERVARLAESTVRPISLRSMAVINSLRADAMGLSIKCFDSRFSKRNMVLVGQFGLSTAEPHDLLKLDE